jgi:site-specific recombinase XerC
VSNTVRLFHFDHPELELHELDENHLIEWFGQKRKDGVSDSTLKKYVQRLKGLLGWCAWQQLIPGNPAEHLEKTLSLRPKRVRIGNWLEYEDVSRFLDSFEPLERLTLIEQRDVIVLRLGFTAGLRNLEIRTLPLKSLDDLEHQRITFVGKGGKLADVFVPERTAALLGMWRARYVDPKPESPVVVQFRNLQNWTTGDRVLTPTWGAGITQQAIGRIVADRTRAVLGRRLSPHDMRRSYANIMEKKVGVIETSRAMRHAQISTTQLYLEERQDIAFQAAKGAGIDL